MDVAGLLKTKTFWTGLAGLIGAVGGYLTGAIDLKTAIEAAFASLVTIFLRDAILKTEK